MSIDVRMASLSAAAEGRVDLHVWRDDKGAIVDSWPTNPGENYVDSGIANRLSQNLGMPVVFTGKIAAQEAATLISSIEGVQQ